MTIEERIKAMEDVFSGIRTMARNVGKAGYSSLDEMGVAYRALPGVGNGNLYSNSIAEINAVRKFLTPSSDVKDDEQQLLQQILNKVDNTLTSTQYLPGSRVLNLEDLNAFLEYVIPIWLSLEQAKRNAQFWQNNGNQTD